MAPPQGNRIHVLDAARGVAILLILLLHAGALSEGLERHAGLHVLFSRMAVGMQLFFVLSGYLISASWQRLRASGHPRPLWAYGWRRAAKIVPLYLLALHVNLALFIWQSAEPGFQPLRNSVTAQNLVPANYLVHLVFAQGLVPAWIHSLVDGSWSVAAEVYFYLLFPLVLARCCRHSIATAWGYLFALVFALAFAQAAKGAANAWGYYGLPAQLPCFLLGVLVHQWEAEGRLKALRPWAPVGLGLCALLALGLVKGATAPVSLHHVYALLFAAALACALAWPKAQELASRWPLLRQFGAMSYALFFSHLVLLKLAHPWISGHLGSRPFAWTLGLNIAISLLGSYVLSRFLLHPIDQYIVQRAQRTTDVKP